MKSYMIHNNEIGPGPSAEFDDDDSLLPIGTLEELILQDQLRVARNKPILANALDEVLDLIKKGIPLDQIKEYIDSYLATKNIDNIYIGIILFEDVSGELIEQAVAIRVAVDLLSQGKTEVEISQIIDARYEHRFNLEVINFIVDRAISIFRKI